MGIRYHIEYQFLSLAPSLRYTETVVISIFYFLPRYFWLIIVELEHLNHGIERISLHHLVIKPNNRFLYLLYDVDVLVS